MRRSVSSGSVAAACRRFVGLLPLLAIGGCGYPVVEPANLEIVTSLRTACSARDPSWLAANEEKIDKRRAAGRVRDDEYAAFAAIIRQARDGDWADAEAACLKFQKAQRPTPEQVARLRAFHEK